MKLPSLIHKPETTMKPLRGALPLSPAQAARFSADYGGPTAPVLGTDVPEPLRFRTMTLQGGQGAGKTLTVFDAVAPRLARMADPGANERLILVDLKGDITALVLGARKVICPSAPVYFLNPFERFRVAPDPHEFVADPNQIMQLVQALTFRRRDARTDDFFDSMGRNHLVLLTKLMAKKAPGRWGWRTLLQVATSYDLHRRALRASRAGRMKATPMVQKTFAGVVSTIEGWLGPYEPAFACSDRCPRLRLNDFLRRPGILIISCPEDQREAFVPVIRALLRFARDRLLADTGRDRGSFTTLVLDEFADLEGLAPVIAPFFGKSRSANVAILVAWQSWPAACLSHGELEMKGILDNAAVRLYMQCGPESIEVAVKDCLQAEVRRPEWSYGYDREDGLAPGLLDPGRPP